MSYLMITSIEKIDTKDDLFAHSDANGTIIAIKQVHLFNDDGKEERICRLTKELIDRIKQVKIKI